ncbi:MAG: YqjF family protein [Candidatus Binatia bacterium]
MRRPAQPSAFVRLQVRDRPLGSPVMFQKWRDLLFLHWAYDVTAIQRTLPAGLYVDTFHGKAYLGIVPFFIRDVRPRFFPTFPGVSDFLELNFRTYVYDDRGIPGIWFYSLDANQWLAVQAARILFHLPYYYAAMQAETNSERKAIRYSSHRHGSPRRLETGFVYRSLSNRRQAEIGTLGFFLIERYVLFAYTEKNRRLYSGRVWHLPYPLEDADVGEWDANLFALDGFSPPESNPDHIIMSPGVDVDVFRLELVAA